jgi:very-short-patch-repair endonuclease
MSRAWRSSVSQWRRLRDAARAARLAPTRAERIFWSNVRAHRLGGLKFRRQHAIGPFIADFYCSEARIVVELDGPVHDGTQHEDRQRDAYIEHQGLLVLRFDNNVIIDDIDRVLAIILAVARERIAAIRRDAALRSHAP